MADFTKVRYTLAVLDLAKSTDYYTSILGLGIDFTAPGWTFLSRGSFRVMLGECTDAIPLAKLGGHSWHGYVTVSSAFALFAEYQAAGAEFTQTLSDNPWGMRELGIRPGDGYRIMFGQELWAVLTLNDNAADEAGASDEAPQLIRSVGHFVES